MQFPAGCTRRPGPPRPTEEPGFPRLETPCADAERLGCGAEHEGASPRAWDVSTHDPAALTARFQVSEGSTVVAGAWLSHLHPTSSYNMAAGPGV